MFLQHVELRVDFVVDSEDKGEQLPKYSSLGTVANGFQSSDAVGYKLLLPLKGVKQSHEMVMFRDHFAACCPSIGRSS